MSLFPSSLKSASFFFASVDQESNSESSEKTVVSLMVSLSSLTSCSHLSVSGILWLALNLSLSVGVQERHTDLGQFTVPWPGDLPH
jgi:hypothetical protein